LAGAFHVGKLAIEELLLCEGIILGKVIGLSGDERDRG
jgi:hypothetical protein